MAKRVAGGFMLAFGALLGGFIIYDLFNGGFQESGRRIFGGMGFTGALIYVGSMWVQGKTAE